MVEKGIFWLFLGKVGMQIGILEKATHALLRYPKQAPDCNMNSVCPIPFYVA